MSAFGKRSGMGGGGRPSFGVAKPMKGGPGSGAATGTPGGGNQFPPLEELTQPEEARPGDSVGQSGAMYRLPARQNARGDQDSSTLESLEASVHRLNQPMLPRQLEHADPDAAPTLIE